jgi:hypothetical protein
MIFAVARRSVLVLPLVLLAACQQAKSANPLSPTIAGPIAGVSVEVPKPMSPPASTQIAVDQQPITLTVENATTNGVRPLSYIFEIATDNGFTTKVFTQTGVAPGENGRTSLRLTQNLTPERTYYWRAKADDGANASSYSNVVSFQVYTPVVIQAPDLREPGDGTTVSSRRPTFSVTNAKRTGPAGAIQYLFEVATDAAMGNKVISVLANEGSEVTSHATQNDLSYGTRYYWRVKALDVGHEGPFSPTRSFTTPAAPVVSNPDPTPSNPGSPAANDHIDMNRADIISSPSDFASWPITSAITAVDMTRNGIHVEFDKNNGRNRWPDVFPPGWDEPLQFTLGMCLNISGKWRCSAVIQFWNGLHASGGPPENYAQDWFYDQNRWGIMTGYQPKTGETIGIFVCAGNCRNNTRGDNSTVKERTNVVLVPMPSSNGASYRF